LGLEAFAIRVKISAKEFALIRRKNAFRAVWAYLSNFLTDDSTSRIVPCADGTGGASSGALFSYTTFFHTSISIFTIDHLKSFKAHSRENIGGNEVENNRVDED
jgi:hypothetical protein